MKKKYYLQIIQENLKSSAKDWLLGAVGENEPKHTSEVVKEWLNQARI